MQQPNTQQRHEHEPVYRRNFVFFLLDNILFTLAINIIGPTTLIPDFVRHLTRSEILIGLSSSIWDAGWTLPQLFIARYIVRSERKKWWFAGPNIPVRFVMFAFALMTLALGADNPSAILVAFFVCYATTAVGDGVVSVPWSILIGTGLNGRWRARMLGLTTAISGIIMLGVSPLIGVILSSESLPFPNNYALLFGAAGVFFILSILPPLFIHEVPSGTVAAKIPSLAEFLPELGHVLRSDSAFRAMIITRMLTRLFLMASPFYIGFATVRLELSSTVAVPTLLAMQTIGSIGGALLYTWLGARNNLLYIRLALGFASLLPISALLAAVAGPLPLYFGFLIAGLTTTNLFSGYLMWVIAHATPDQRPTYTGLFNTIGAVVSLIAPFIAGTIVQQIGYEPLFIVALVMVLAALFMSLRYIQSPQAAKVLTLAAAD